MEPFCETQTLKGFVFYFSYGVYLKIGNHIFISIVVLPFNSIKFKINFSFDNNISDSIILCLFVQIKFLKTKEGTAMVQMGDSVAVERCVQHLNNIPIGGDHKLQIA